MHYTEIVWVIEDIWAIRLCLLLLENRVREVPFQVLQFCITFSTFTLNCHSFNFKIWAVVRKRINGVGLSFSELGTS